MKSLWQWAKFFLVDEANPIKTEVHLNKIFWFRDDIKDARRKQDWYRVWQYWFMIVQIGLFCGFCSHMYGARLSEFDSYIRMDVHSWLHSDKIVYHAGTLFSIFVAFTMYLLYFTTDVDHFANWLKKIVLENKPEGFHWPYHYKHKKCTPLIRTTFLRLLWSFQAVTVIAGEFFFGISIQH